MQQSRPGRSAILAPGGGSSADVPLLMYARLAVQRRGGQAHPILQRAAGPCGTADQFWDRQAARAITPHVVEIDGADHGMLVPGRLAASAAVLGHVITAVEDFLDRVVWP